MQERELALLRELDAHNRDLMLVAAADIVVAFAGTMMVHDIPENITRCRACGAEDSTSNRGPFPHHSKCVYHRAREWTASYARKIFGDPELVS